MSFRRRLANLIAGPETKASPAPLPSYGGWGSMLWNWGSTVAPSRADVPAHMNVVVSASLGWLSRSLPVADLKVVKQGGDEAEIEGHALIALMDRPNALDTFHSFWQSILLSDLIDGNTFILKIRNRLGIHSLWWAAPWDVVVVPSDTRDADRPIQRYDVTVGGKVIEYAPEDVIHIRDGRDPYDPFRGMALLKAAALSRGTIDEAERFSRTLMRNCGAIPTVVGTKDGSEIYPENVPSLRKQWDDNQTGDNNGKPLFATGPLTVSKLGLTPEEMAISKIYDWPVAFITAQLGVPSMVLGLPDAGKTYSNLQEATKGAWQNGLIPRQQRFAEAFNRHCPELIGANERLIWCYQKVDALQVDWWARMDGLIKAAGGKAIISINEGRSFLNLEKVPDGDKVTPDPPPPQLAIPVTPPMPALPAPDPTPAEAGAKGGLCNFLHKDEGEDDARPFGFKDDMPPLVPNDQVDPHEDNTYGLPDGAPIRKKLKAVFAAQAAEVLGTIPEIGAPIPDVFLPLTDYDDPMASAMTPILSAYWDAAGKQTRARLGLDPAAWRVVDPNVHRAIQDAALAFCKSTNETTTKNLNDALADLRRELAEGIVTEGETIAELTKRVRSIFTGLSRDHAEVIARTETARAVHAASIQSAIDSGVCERKVILLSANACPLCHRLYDETKDGIPLDGSFGVVGNHPVYSDLKMPPFHPSCRCSYSLVLSEEYRNIIASATGNPAPDSVQPFGDGARVEAMAGVA